MTTLSPLADPDDVDGYISLDHAPRLIPGRPHRATVWRWVSHGVTRGGNVIRLRSIMSGGRRYTRPDWITDFLARLNADNPTQQPAPSMTPARRQRQAAAAMATLAQMGVTTGK